MDRYFHNEHDDEENFNFGPSKEDLIDVMEMEIAEFELNEKLLDQAARIASAEWNWIFRSTSYKMRKVHKIFARLKKIVQEE